MAIELELPALYVDAIVMDPTSVRPAIINRDPEPGEEEVPVATLIAFDLIDVGADGIDLGATQVFVGGVLVLSAGAFRPGYQGPGSTVSAPEPDMLRIVVDPIAPFESLQDVPVRVVTRTMGGAFQLDTTWSFRCEDLSAPLVTGAHARGLGRVRVSFDEPVRLSDPLAAGDALDPQRYSLTRLSAPAVDAAVSAAERATDSSVDLITDLDLSPSARYRVTVTGVLDLFGNEVLPPGNTADFTGFVPARPPRRRFDLYQLLPMLNRREDETESLRRFLGCLQEPTELLLGDIDRFTDIFDPDIAPEPFVDAMLLDLGNPFPFDLSLTDKRRLVNILVAVYREKGTAAGIKNVIRFFLGVDVELTTYTGEGLVLGEAFLGEDWVLGPSGAFSAYGFEVMAGQAMSTEERRRLRTIIEYMKPAHTHFVRLVEPEPPFVVDHVELGLSELGETWVLH